MFLKNKNKNLKDKQVVILGAGFAGLSAAIKLARQAPKLRVILVSEHNYHLYYPALYEVATARRLDAGAVTLKQTVAVSLDQALRRYRNIVFKQAIVSNIDPERQLVETDTGNLYYDTLTVAMGSQTDYCGVPGLDNALTLKSLDDAIRIRNQIEQSYRNFKEDNNPAHLRIVVGGGGFTGVELAAELSNYTRHLNEQFDIKDTQTQIYVIEGADRLLPGLSSEASKVVAGRLENLGLKIILGQYIDEVRQSLVLLKNGKKIIANNLIWTGGVKASPVPFSKKVPVDNKGRILLSSRLNLDLYPDIFIAGDCGAWIDPATERPQPQTAQLAVDHANFIAKANVFYLKGDEVPIYRPKKRLPVLIPLSGRYAMLVLGERFYVGFWPYVLRRLADLKHLLSVLPWRKAWPFWLKGSYIYLKND